MEDTLNLSGLFSTNPTFPKNDIFADYIYYNPENINGSLENSLIKDINDDIKIIENGKKEINQNFFNKNLINQIPKNQKIKDPLINNQKKIFETYNGNEKESQKQKKLMMNRISAKKSRLKKKVYIKCLEDELIKIKNEIEKKNNFEKIYFEGICKKDNEKGIANFSSEIQKYNNLITIENNLFNKSKNDNQDINDYVNLQKNFILDIFIKQIKVLMPIKCKLFQNKFLKLQKFENDDSIEKFINKINENIEMLKELYDFEIPFKQLTNKKSESMALQLYNYYYNLKNYLVSFKKIFESII